MDNHKEKKKTKSKRIKHKTKSLKSPGKTHVKLYSPVGST